MPKPRMTLQVQLVLGEMLSEPAESRYGLDLGTATGLPSGTIYPILARLEGIGWVESDWEDPDAHITEGRPRRRGRRLGCDQSVVARSGQGAYLRPVPSGPARD